MHELHVDICKGKNESVHNYLWMVRWLDMCMELSEISRPLIRARLKALIDWLLRLSEFLDGHIKHYHQMCDDSTIDWEKLQKHVEEGRHHEYHYKRYEGLLIAMDIVDMLTEHIQCEVTWKPCSCTKCDFYRSSEWMKIQPRSEPCALDLPATQLYMGEYFMNRRFY